MEGYPLDIQNPLKQVLAVVNMPTYHPKIKKKFVKKKRVKILSFNTADEINSGDKQPTKKNIGMSWKRGWVQKHQTLVASVYIVLCTLNLSKTLEEEEKRIIATIEQVRQKLSHFQTKPKVVVVMLCDEALPVSHFFDDFIKSLKQSCHLENKLIYFCEIKQLDSPLSLQKFERTMVDLSTQHYKEKLLRVRKLKNEVKKELNPLLYTRHRMKVGLLHEMIGNNVRCLKYYVQAYQGWLASDKKFPHGRMEHYMGDWCNFKVVTMKIFRDNNKVAESIQQFTEHMKIAREKTFEPVHEYYRAMYRQYKMFADLLVGVHNMRKVQLKMEETFQNPAHYYHLAGVYAKLRDGCFEKTERWIKLSEEVYKEDSGAIKFGVNEKEDEMFLKTGYVGEITLYTSEDEKTAIEKALGPSSSKDDFENVRSAAREVFFKHSQEIVSMFSKAVTFYLSSKSKGHSSIIENLKVMMADEEYRMDDFDKARRIYNRVLPNMLNKRWLEMVGPVLKKLLHCNKNLGITKDVVKTVLYLLHHRCHENNEDIKEFLDMFEGLYSEVEVFKKFELPDIAPFEEDMTNHPLIDLQVNFSDAQVVVYSTTECNLRFVSNCPYDIHFDMVHVRFNESKYDIESDDEIVVMNGKEGHEKKNGVTILSFPVTIKEKTDIFIKSVSLVKKMVEREGKRMEIKMTWDVKVGFFPKRYTPSEHVTDGSGAGFILRSVLRVVEPESKVELSLVHTPPMMVRELYPVLLSLKSNTEHVLSGKIIISDSTQSSSDENHEFIIYDSDYKILTNQSLELPEEIPPGEECQLQCYLSCSRPAQQRKIKFLFEYRSSLYPDMKTSTTKPLDVVLPFVPLFSVLAGRGSCDKRRIRLTGNSTDFRQRVLNSRIVIGKIGQNTLFVANEPLIMNTALKLDIPFSLQIRSVELKLKKKPGFQCLSPLKIHCVDSFPKRNPADVVDNLKSDRDALKRGDVFSFNHVLIPSTTSEPAGIKQRVLGKLILTCKRIGTMEVRDFDFELPLPVISVINSPLLVYYDWGAKVVVGEELVLSIKVINCSELVQDIQLTARDSKEFLMSGVTELIFEMIPYQERVFKYSLIPLQSGECELPKFVIASLTNSFIVMQNESWNCFVKNKLN